MDTEAQAGTTWHWRIPELKHALGTTGKILAAHAALRQATLSGLQGQRDSQASVLIQVYRAARAIQPTITLHDVIAVENEPNEIVVRRHVLLDAMVPLPHIADVYLGTPLLRHYYAPTADDPLGSCTKVARAVGQHVTVLWRLEHGVVQPRISTLIQLYRLFIPFDPTLNLHDVLLLPDADLPPDAPIYAPYHHAETTHTLLDVWKQLSAAEQQGALKYLTDLRDKS
ncbi:hypothetical protein EKD04_025540 [Chloroflexales bacterium ZM16-3]|nr:hypothetical protein [Chloroflexales bacterium ZM16-3]